MWNCSTLFHELVYCETQDCGQLTICKTVTINLFVSSLSIIFQTLQHLSRNPSAERPKCLHVNKLVPTVSTLSALLSGNRSKNFSGLQLVQSLNSPFFPPHIGAEPGRAKEESRITCMRMLRTNQSKLTRSQPRCSRQCVAQCLFQLAL